MSYCCNYWNANQGQGSNNKSHRSHRSHGNQGNTVDTKTYLTNLVGQTVKINRGGPESFQGKMLAVKSDYLVLDNAEGIVYVSTSHVKSITDMPSNGSGGRQSNYVNASNFNGVIRGLNQKFVQVNWGGPEKVEGFLAEVGNESILLVFNKEVMQIPLFHIKTIKEAGGKSGGNKSGNNSNNNTNNNNKSNKNNNKSNSKNNNKSNAGGNRSGGSQSGGRSGGQGRGANAAAKSISSKRSMK